MRAFLLVAAAAAAENGSAWRERLGLAVRYYPFELSLGRTALWQSVARTSGRLRPRGCPTAISSYAGAPLAKPASADGGSDTMCPRVRAPCCGLSHWRACATNQTAECQRSLGALMEGAVAALELLPQSRKRPSSSLL